MTNMSRMPEYQDEHPLVRKATFTNESTDDDAIPEDVLRLRFLTSEELESNYWNMSLAFSINHGCAVCCLTYASTVLGDKLGSIGNGLLYCIFAFTAAFLSKPFVLHFGAKKSLVVACFGYTIFVLGFFAAVLGSANDDDADDTVAVEPAWAIYLVACVCGGLAGGLLWTAQGRYFAHSARLASNDSGQPIEQTNNSFAATFAFLYLGSEMVLKLVATFLYSISWGGIDSDIVVFGVYPCISLISAVFMLWIRDLNDDQAKQTTVVGGFQQAIASFSLSFCELRLTLLLPFQISFGFATSFVTYYVFGTIVSDSTVLGETYVGLLSATIVFTGACIAMPSAMLSSKYGKPLVMVCGGIALALMGLFCFVFNTSILGTWEMIIPLMIIFGIARGTWENTNRAVIADFFFNSPDKATSAFAAISFFNGFAAGIGYFVFYFMSRVGMAGIITGTALFAVACYLIATHIPGNSAVTEVNAPRRIRVASSGDF